MGAGEQADILLGHHYGSQILGQNWRNLYITPSCITLAFQNRLEDCNTDVRRLHGNAVSIWISLAMFAWGWHC